MIFQAPTIDHEEEKVLHLIREQWQRLRWVLRNKPAPWTGVLRRSALARGIRGSNSIEGLEVSEDDAAAIVEGDEPFDASEDAPGWRAVVGYREAMTHVLQQGADPDAAIDRTLLRSLHYMMIRHEPEKHPGSWRPGAIKVFDERKAKVVYEAPDRAVVPALMEELIGAIPGPENESSMVTAAMSHLNLAMIHPFSDGNGRMARCLQTLVLAKAGVLDPVFCSVEEWLGDRRNTEDYYDVLAEVGGGSWSPRNDARPWIRFMLKAHYQQAYTFERRQQELSLLWDAVERKLSDVGFNERATAALVEAAWGRSLRNSRYRHHADVSALTASRDLKALVEAGLLVHFGKKRGRYYKASDGLLDIRRQHRVPRDVPDPFAL